MNASLDLQATLPVINSHNEWDPLEEIIIGVADNAQTPVKDAGQMAIEFPDCKDINELPAGRFPKKVIEESAEDLDQFANELQKLGITVRRPAVTDHSKKFSTPDWESDGFYNYCPRDVFLVVGNTLIEAPMVLRSRFLETFAYKEILIDYLRQNARWISAPKPRLSDAMYNTENPAKLPLNNLEPAFDAANVLRMGRDLLYLVSSSGNELGYHWLKAMLGSEYRIHPCYDLYESIHIDSTLALLRPGLALLNPARVNKDNLPPILKDWDHIWAPDMVDPGFVGKHAYSSVWVGMNLLMINPNLAVVDKIQVPLIRELERRGINVLPLSLRHSRTLGGGFHCVTLDVRRRGQLEDYT